jgi:drug/metabolite transporter (DMT)-like permease
VADAADAAVVVPRRRISRHALHVALAMAIVWVLWGSVYVAVRVVVEDAPPVLTVGPRYVVAGLALGAIAVARRGFAVFRITRRELLGCALLALLLPILTNATVVVAVSLGVGAGPAALLSALTPISIALLRVADGDRPPPATIVGVVVGFAGLAVLLLGGQSVSGFPLWPSIIVVVSANFWAIGSFLQPRLELPRDVFATAACEMVLGGLVLTALAVASGEHISSDWPAKTWLAMLYLTFSTMIAFTSYVWLLNNARISLASTHAYVNPVVAVLLAWLLLSEAPTWPVIAGGLVVIAAVALVIRGERPAPEPRPTAECPPPT